jgi:hypothetical protein
MNMTPQSAFFLIADERDVLEASRDRTLDIFGLVDGYATSHMQADLPDTYQSSARLALTKIPALGPLTGGNYTQNPVSCQDGVARVLGRLPFSQPGQQVEFLIEQGLLPVNEDVDSVALTLYCGAVSMPAAPGAPTSQVWFAFVNWTRDIDPDSSASQSTGSISFDVIGASVVDTWFEPNSKAWTTMTKAGNAKAVRASGRLLVLPACAD